MDHTKRRKTYIFWTSKESIMGVKRKSNFNSTDLKSILIKCSFLKELQCISSKNCELFNIIINSLNSLKRRESYNIQNNLRNRRRICSMAKFLLKNCKVVKSGSGTPENADSIICNIHYDSENEISKFDNIPNKSCNVNCFKENSFSIENDYISALLNSTNNNLATENKTYVVKAPMSSPIEKESSLNECAPENFQLNTNTYSQTVINDSPQKFRKDVYEHIKSFEELKSDLKIIKDSLVKVIDKMSLCSNQEIIESNKNCKPQFYNILEHSSKELKLENDNRNHTLGPFEISDDTLNVSKFIKYRKEANPDEKCNRIVLREEAKSLRPKRIFQRKIFDCSFSINLSILKDFNDIKITKKKLLEDIVREEYLKHNNVCILCFYCVKSVKENTFIYAYCRFNDCTTFRFEINPNGDVSVYRTKEIQHAKDEMHVGQIRGVKRSVFKSKLKNNNAYLFRKQQILNAADEIAEKGNLQDICSLEALRKCKSEGNYDYYYHSETIFSLILMKRGPYKNYIHLVSSPFAVYTWEKITFETISSNKEILEDSKFTLHLDASGESVKQLECAEKRILIYKLVLRNCKLKKIVPIAEAILSRHTRDAICSFLDCLKFYLKENKIKYQFKWSFCKRVCTDVSAALYGAVLKSFNNQTLLEYLNACATFLNHFKVNPNSKPEFVILQWCKCHYIHIMCKDLDAKLGRRHILRPLLKYALIAAFNLTTMEEAQQWFKHMFIVLLTPFKSPKFERSIEILRQCLIEVDEESKGKEYNLPDNDQNLFLESIAFNSPFRKMFLSIFNEIENDIKQINKGHDLNPYRNDEICLFILNKYCPFIVLWTNIMGIHVDSSGEHVSNAPVEFAFYLQKHIILPQKSVRADVFVKVMRMDYLSSLKELRYKYKMFGSISEKIEDILTSSLNNLNEEVTSTRLKKEHCYVTSTPINKEVDDVDIVEKDHSYSQNSSNIEPVEEWKKKDFKKQKVVRPKVMFASKASKKISKIKKIENKLIKQDKFYLFKFDLLYTEINNINNPIEVGFMDYLETSDWNSLKNGNWLTNFVLDSCLLAILKDSRSTAWFCMPTQSNEINVETISIFIQNQAELLFVPILSLAHFTLCILKLGTYEFIYVNSLKDFSVGKRVYDLLIAKLESNKNSWTYREITEREMQDDGSNCGIFVLMYALKIIQNKPLTNLWNPKDFRKKMRILLLKHQGDRSRFCCHCGNLKKTNGNIFICEDCIFYICQTCTVNHRSIGSKACKVIEQDILSI